MIPDYPPIAVPMVPVPDDRPILPAYQRAIYNTVPPGKVLVDVALIHLVHRLTMVNDLYMDDANYKEAIEPIIDDLAALLPAE